MFQLLLENCICYSCSSLTSLIFQSPVIHESRKIFIKFIYFPAVSSTTWRLVVRANVDGVLVRMYLRVSPSYYHRGLVKQDKFIIVIVYKPFISPVQKKGKKDSCFLRNSLLFCFLEGWKLLTFFIQPINEENTFNPNAKLKFCKGKTAMRRFRKTKCTISISNGLELLGRVKAFGIHYCFRIFSILKEWVCNCLCNAWKVLFCLL